MKSHNKLIRLLNECAMACDHCAAACLKEMHVAHLANCISSDISCASVCRTTALLLEQGFCEQKALELCEQICRICASECSKHEHEHCKACAKVCTQCADECKEVARE